MAWTNWSGSITSYPQAVERPRSEAEIRAIVRRAEQTGQTVQVVGSGHSFTPLCAGAGVLIMLDELQGVISTNAETQEATVWAGTKIYQLGQPLRQAGLAMANMGDIDRQAIAGAISTGTHGTGQGLGSISTQVTGLRLVTSAGEVVECSANKEPDIFKAGQVALGALGVISQITLRCVPAYRLHQKTWALPVAECLAQLEPLIAQNRHFEFFWSPAEDVCAVKTLNPTSTAPGDLPVEGPAAPGRLARYLGPERIDDSYKIFPSERTVLFNETEFAVPAADGPACFLEICRLMQTKYPDVVWPIEYRTLAADDIYLSPAYQRQTVTISVHQAHNLPYQLFFADVEAIFKNYQGRPHWGKIHTHTAPELEPLYPMWTHFQKIRKKLDPQGCFMNEYLHAIFEWA